MIEQGEQHVRKKTGPEGDNNDILYPDYMASNYYYFFFYCLPHTYKYYIVFTTSQCSIVVLVRVGSSTLHNITSIMYLYNTTAEGCDKLIKLHVCNYVCSMSCYVCMYYILYYYYYYVFMYTRTNSPKNCLNFVTVAVCYHVRYVRWTDAGLSKKSRRLSTTCKICGNLRKVLDY